MATKLPPLATAKLPPLPDAEEHSLRARRARLTQAIRQLEARHQQIVQRHAELVAEHADVDRRWQEMRRPQAS
jgi:hypothetical protein